MAFPGLIGGVFCKTQETNPYGLRFLSQALYPPEVINVVGFLAQENWEGGGLRGLGFCAGAGSRIWVSGAGVLTPTSSTTSAPSVNLAGGLHPQPTQDTPSPQAFPGAKTSSTNPALLPCPPCPSCCLPSACLQVPCTDAHQPVSLSSSMCDLFPLSDWEVTESRIVLFPSV